jgi:hypothetical protein
MSASWAVVTVGRDDPPRSITFRTAAGRRIDTSTVRFVSREESGFS